MNGNRDALVELTTQPLAWQQEIRAVAAQQLHARIEAADASDARIAEAIDLLERADRRGILRHWKWVLYGLVAALVIAGVVENLGMRKNLRILSGMGSLYPDEPPPKVQRPARFSADELLLLYGREGVESEAEKWKPLWESNPQNPVYFAEYVAAVLQDTDSVPDEILQKAAGIDPDNGWYLTMKAGALLKNSVTREKQKDRERDEMRAVRYTVTDEDKLARGLALLYEAAHKPQFDSYQQEIMRERLTVMGKPRDWFGSITRMAYVAGDFMPGLSGTRMFSQALAVEAERCAEKGDRDGFLRAISAWEALCVSLLEDGSTVLDMLVTKVVITDPAANFRDSARKLGLENEAARFEELARWQHEDWKRRNTRHGDREIPEVTIMMEQKMSLMASLSLPMVGSMVRKPPVLTEHDVTPSRLMEYAFIQRMCVGAGSLCLLFVMGAAALRLACSSRINLALSRRISEMLPAREWALILGIGGVLPVVWYGIILYLTPLSSRDWSLRVTGIHLFALQFVSLIILIPTLTSALVSWRCDRRLGLLCGISKLPKWRWVMVTAASLALPLSGAFLPLLHSAEFQSSLFMMTLWVAAGLLAIAFLWMACPIIKPAFGKQDPTPRTATLIRMALPGVCAGILTLAAASLAMRWEERHWLAKDRLMLITPDASAMSRYEWDVTQVLRGELRELLGKK